jgi:two-component system response regulator AtoC
VAERPLVLVVDDDPAVAVVLLALLDQAELDAIHAASGAEALARLAKKPIDLVLSDVRMPGMDGMALLGATRQGWPDLPVILVTAHGSVPLAVEAMKAGAADFILKPFDREEVLYAVRKALAAKAPAAPIGEARRAPPGEGRSPLMEPPASASAAMREVAERIEKVARSTSTVLIRGESGTGKERVAHAIHDASPRRGGPFIAVHCGALPEALLESELFGYEQGAFTGAAQRKPGRIELAHGGTLFLDEIGDVPPAMQVKLLRVLQERSFERLGGVKTVTVDVRFVAATHRDLEAMASAGEFREDLLYRLNVVPVWLLPLRERREDIEPLARHFLAAFAASNGRPTPSLDPAAMRTIVAAPWPGNVRQLQNLIERLVVLCDGPILTAADVERELSPKPAARTAEPGETLDDKRREAERQALVDALARCAQNRTACARVLGISRRTLYYKLKEHGLL